MSVTGNATPAGAWFRVSTGGQDEQNQVPDIEQQCAAHGYDIKRRYTVHGKSAYHGQHQKDLDAALADARAGTIKVLVIWHSSRIERRPGKALLDVLAEFADAGCRVESVQEPTLGQLDFGGQVTTFLAGLLNHEKSRLISEQVRIKHDALKAAGSFIGKVPWGYEVTRLDDGRKTLVPTPEGRKYAPVIYQRAAEGESLSAICGWLDAEGVAAPGGGRWWPRTLGLWIRNPVSMGFRCVYDDRKRHTHGEVVHRIADPLVPADLWQRAIGRLDTAPGKRRPASRENRAMLMPGLIFCPRCGSPMYRIMSRTGLHYRCAGRGPNRKGCGVMVPLERADAAVCQIAETSFRWQKITVTTLIPGSSHDAELAEVAFQIRQLGADYAAERIGDDEHEQRLAALVAERKRLKALPAEPDRVVETELDETYADRWAALQPSERGPWLLFHGFRVEASREGVTLSQPDHPKAPAWTVTL
jgi:DNA invertase Pin-like site-specific DNA recombinase